MVGNAVIETVTVSNDELHRFARLALESREVTPEQAAICADVMVEQDLRGHGHHGTANLRARVADVDDGVADPRAEMEVLAEMPAMIALDARRALGPVVSVRAMDACIAKAKTQGVGLATVRQMPHWVIPAYYSMRAAAQGLIGYCVCYTNPSFAPVGGKTRVLGNNPLSYAIPADPRPPVVVDFGVSPSSGRIRNLRDRGQPLPAGWAMDADGKPITEPAEAMREAVFLPVGEHRGYGLGLINELLGGPLNAMPISLLRSGRGIMGSVFMAWRTDLFRPHDEFLRDVNAGLDALVSAPRRDPKVPVRYPGERSGLELRRNRARGKVDLSGADWRILQSVAEHTGVEPPPIVAGGD